MATVRGCPGGRERIGGTRRRGALVRVNDLLYRPKIESIRWMLWSFCKLKVANVSRNVLITSPGHLHLKGNSAEP